MKGTSYFRFRGRLCLFKILKIFYPPKGVCEAAPEGSIWRSFHFIMCSSKGTGHLRFWWGNPRFWNLQNVLSPEGSLRSSSEGVHLTVFPFYYVFQKGYWASSFLARKSAFLKSSKCFSVWMGGWVVIVYPLRFSLFSSMITSNMCLFQKLAWKLYTPFR